MKKYNNMAEFAAALGLSRSTVSYILNDKWKERHISEKTAQKVLEYASEMDFTPNFLGLAINGKISIDVALLLPRETFEHHRQAFFDLLALIEKHQRRCMVFQLGDEDYNRMIIRRLQDFKVHRAVIFAPPLLRCKEDLIWWRQVTSAMPETGFCFYDYRFDRPTARDPWPENVVLVGFDNNTGKRAIYDYITNAGYRRIIAASADDVRDLKKRFAGTALEIIHTGLPQGEDPYAYGRDLGNFLLSVPRDKSDPAAVFINDDTTSAVAMELLLRHGVEIPGEFAFISWDGLKISRFFSRSLTTMEIPHWEMLDFASDFAQGKAVPPVLEVIPLIRIGDSMPPGR